MAAFNGDMNGKVCLVTGATRGLGWGTTLGLARQGARVVLVGRSQARLDQAVLEIQAAADGSAAGNGHAPALETIRADLSSLSEVRRVAEAFRHNHDRLDVLVNNVGATMLAYEESAEGYEMTWSLNYLGHFLLTHLLAEPLLRAAAQAGEARVVEVTSHIYRYSDPQMKKLQQRQGYNGVKAYAQSKRALILFAREFARQAQGSGVTANAVSPGVVRTNIATQNAWIYRAVMRLVNLFAVPLEEGSQTLIRAASDPGFCGVSGKYIRKYAEPAPDPALDDREVAQRLWQLSQQQTGLC